MNDEIYTIVVADDEPEIREAMCQMIRWEEAGFRLLGSAGNGVDALQLVEQLQPDLLLTDIDMPFISGTALARQVRELQPLIQIAFLSGYDDFEYAQSAIENRVIAYLLKPMSIAELTGELRAIHRKMQERFRELRPAPVHISRHVLTAALLLDEFASLSDEKAVWQQFCDSGMIFTEPYQLTVLSVGSVAGLDQSAAQAVEKTLLKHYGCCAVASGGRVLCLLVSEDGFKRLGTALDELYCVGKRLLGATLSIGVSRSFTKLIRAHAACREAVDAQMLADGDGIIRWDGAKQGFSEGDRAAAIERLLLTGEKGELERWVQRAMEDSRGDSAAIRLLFSAPDVLVRHLGEQDTLALLRRYGLDEPLRSGAGPDEAGRRAVDFLLAGADRIRDRRKSGTERLCERALSVIEREYMDEQLSLSVVSERLHVSPNYLSAQIKKYAGETFINLLIKKRMEAAALLLRDREMKIAEVARRCGYNDQHYFSYCFKKYYGVSPSARRQEGERP